MAHDDASVIELTGKQPSPAPACTTATYSRFAVFDHCPQCGGDMAPEHAHFRCRSCGWRDSCCD
ncbi:MAG: hypothetical protein AAF547_02985 [Actinomycetota bacterium]